MTDPHTFGVDVVCGGRKDAVWREDYDRLAAAYLRARDKLLEICDACDPCGGTGCVKTDCEPIMVIDCPECADIREILA